MSILIGADIVPTAANKKYFETANMEAVLGGKLVDLIRGADYRIFNLEVPLANKDSNIPKIGPALRADVSTAKGLSSIDVDLLTIANNHIMDHGYAGLKSTIETLKNNKISYLGAGDNLEDASKPFLFNTNSRIVGVYACVEHEFSVAGKDKPGANPYDSLESFDHVKNLKKQCDFVIVLYHGGRELYRYPSPELQLVCRKFVEKGADLVVCQHSHCIGCEEKYANGTIVYGQGNFIFDLCKTSFSDTSLLLNIDDDFNVNYIPLEKENCYVRLATENKAKEIMAAFYQRSEQIKKVGFVEQEYRKLAKKKLEGYLLTCSGYKHKLIFRALNKLSGGRLTNFLVNRYKKSELLAIRNIVECEAHKELFIEGLKQL